MSDLLRGTGFEWALQPLMPYLDDPAVVEIMLNPDGCIWVERVGTGLELTSLSLAPLDAERILRAIAAEVNAELNAARPSLSCKLPRWGARVQGSIPPVYRAPVFALRKPAERVFSLEEYVERGIMTAQQADILRAAVRAKQNIVVSGSTGTGKTTVLNALLHELEGSSERILIIEDTPELQCRAKNRAESWVSETQEPLYPWHRAVKEAMRMRPDRIILGEVRDGAALDVLDAWTTHSGGFCTLHATSSKAALRRFAGLIQRVIPVPPLLDIAETIHLSVHLRRDPGTARGRVVHAIDRVDGYDERRGWLLSPAA